MRLRRFSSSSLAAVAAVALLGTAFQIGAEGQAPEIFDGSSWLWSRPVGEIARVNGHSGVVDLRRELAGLQDHRVRLTQSDEFLLLHDLRTGQVSSVDLAELSVEGSLAAPGDVVVLLAGDQAVVVDRTRGLVRSVDPVTLALRGEPVQLPPGLVGGGFDGSGRLWLGVPSQGTVVQLAIRDGQAVVERTEPVAEPGGELALTVLDDGVLVADRRGDRLVTVTGDRTTDVPAPVPLAGAVLPERTVGGLAVVTVPDSQALLVLAGGEPARLSLPAGGGVAVPFAGRIYVPDDAAGVVHVLAPDGRELPAVELAGARGPLELEVRQQLLFVNAVDASAAAVVTEGGEVTEVDKFDPDASLPDPEAEPAPEPTPPPPPEEPPAEERPSPRQPQEPPPGPPDPPAPVRVAAGDGRVEVSWNAASAPGGAGVDRYVVSWDGGQQAVPADKLSTMVEGLDNGEEYTFRVVAENAFGQSPPARSEPVTPFAVPDAPGDLVAELVNDSNLRLSWSEPDGNGRAVDHYVVRDAGGDELAQTAQTQLTLTVTGLPEVSVAAVNDAGEGPAATVEVPEPEPEGLSVEITDVLPMDSFLRVSFTVDNPGGGQPRCAVAVGGRQQTADCEGFRVLVQNLQPGQDYTIEVSATAGGETAVAEAAFTTYPGGSRGSYVCQGAGYCATHDGAPSFTAPTSDIGDAFLHHPHGTEVWAVCRVTGPTFDARPYGGHSASDQWLYKSNSATYAPLGFVDLEGSLNEIPQCTH